MFGSRISWRYVKGNACKRIQRALRKEGTVPVHTVDGPLLAHYEVGCSRICEKVPQLPSTSQFHPYLPTKLA